MSYSKGRRFEWHVRRLLEGAGWVVVRAARSKPVDLVAIKDGKILLIECKYEAALSRDRRIYLLELAERAGAAPVLARKRRFGRRVVLVEIRTGEEMDVHGEK